jgi:RND superfamily putative drug exporter
VDAVIVRSALLPALMQMSGKANWWFPGWLDRMLPHLHMESEDADAELAEATEGEAAGVGV